MIDDIAFALWFFLPAGIANMTPVLVAKAPGLRDYNTPIDFGKTWRGVAIFGPNKTWRGLICGVIAALFTIWLQFLAYSTFQWAIDLSELINYHSLYIYLLGFLLGFGALAGDAVKSFFKRRVARDAGASWFPFDQLDYIVGGLLASSLVVVLEPAQYVWIFCVWFLMHLVTSYIGYRLRLKNQPI